MMLAVPGALAGGVLFQALFGYNFSVAVWVGYIACFGMATETGIIMLVYLRDAHGRARRAGGYRIVEGSGERGDGRSYPSACARSSLPRPRPSLGLAPMLWAHGVGAEVMAPMAAPVLGGLLMADEVIDIFLPVLFYHVEKAPLAQGAGAHSPRRCLMDRFPYPAHAGTQTVVGAALTVPAPFSRDPAALHPDPRDHGARRGLLGSHSELLRTLAA